MGRFYTSREDAVVRTLDYRDQSYAIRCNPEGVFYCTFGDPPITIRDRAQSKLIRLLKMEIDQRLGSVSIPFVRVHLHTHSVGFRECIVNRVDENGTGRYIDIYGRSRTTATMFDGERYCRVLTPDERAAIETLVEKRGVLEQQIEDWLEAHRFQPTEALQGQQAGTYPLVHPPEVAEEAAATEESDHEEEDATDAETGSLDPEE